MRDSKKSINPAFVKPKAGFLFSGAVSSQVQAVSLPPAAPAFNRKEYQKKWQENNPLKMKLYKKKYRENNKEKILAYRKIDYKKNGLKNFLYQKKIGAIRAKYCIHEEIKHERLKSLSKNIIKCTDCSRRARCYDHRDYNFPLTVEPVCISCNKTRGSAIHLS